MKLVLIFWTQLIAATCWSSEDRRFCDGLECESKESLLKVIQQLQDENRRLGYFAPYKSGFAIGKEESEATISRNSLTSASLFTSTIAPNSSCDICSSQPCQNGGACHVSAVNPWKSYWCDCPQNYAGTQCQTPIVCQTDTCGRNADCFVANHQLNCICKPGYSGDPRRGCTTKTKQTCISGDPHFTTFDGLHLDYQGTCPYIYSQPCTQLASPFVYYSVRVANAFIGSSRSVSGVSEVEVDMYNLTIHVDGGTRRFIVNGIEQHAPYYWPTKDRQYVTVKYSSGVFYITNDQTVQVVFYVSGSLCVQVPDVAQFQGQSTLCGVGGNLDNNYKNDVVYRNGTVFQITRNPVKYDEAFNRVEDTWITSKFVKIRPNAPACVTGEQISNLTDCDSQAAATVCQPVKQSALGQGPFSDCSVLGNDTIQTIYDNCVFDVCHAPDQKCNVLQLFAKTCQNAVPGGNIGDWRTGTACPPPTCPSHSHYEMCKSSCPGSCADSSSPDFCDLPCSEGCICDPGYVLDNTKISTLTCIPVDQCGCTDANGNSHPADVPFLTNNCDIRSWCKNGTLYSERYGCDPNAVCTIADQSMTCVCLPGFTGNGTTCVDIDECLDPASCNADKGYGNCTNTIGSYHCECKLFFTQPHCQDYLPRRHCADLRHYWGFTDDAVYTISPPYAFSGQPSFTNVTVYCDMNTEGGGWTLMSSDRGNELANKTYQEYIRGFGTPSKQQVWLGLDLINGMTNYESTSLRLNLYRCPHNGLSAKSTYCTYKNFLVYGAAAKYAVAIAEACKGTEEDFYDGWARWNLNETGPAFVAFDNDNTETNCSSNFRNTGWWFDARYRCGAANLNGVRYSCDDVPDDSTSSTYLFWAGSPLGQAWLYLRPTTFPNYDPIPPIVQNLVEARTGLAAYRKGFGFEGVAKEI